MSASRDLVPVEPAHGGIPLVAKVLRRCRGVNTPAASPSPQTRRLSPVDNPESCPGSLPPHEGLGRVVLGAREPFGSVETKSN